MNTIKIGSQEWATEDLKVTKFRNGEDIPLVTDNKEWAQLTTAAYCIAPKGNFLYNWFAVNDPRGLSPEGFHVPTDEEWTELTDALGGSDVAGRVMKVTECNGDNSIGFSALHGGDRVYFSGHFNNQGYYGVWWSSSNNDLHCAWCRTLYSMYDKIFRHYYNHQYGFSVRCLKNL